jgi:hypothetical protein
MIPPDSRSLERPRSVTQGYRRHELLAPAWHPVPATSWLQKRVLLHTVHLASKALEKPRVISTRVIVIEDNQRFHSCVAQNLSTVYVTGQRGLQYVMAGRRLMRGLTQRSGYGLCMTLYSNSLGVRPSRSIARGTRDLTQRLSGLLIRLECFGFRTGTRCATSAQRITIAVPAPRRQLCVWPPPIPRRMDLEALVIFLFPVEQQAAKFSHVLVSFLPCVRCSSQRASIPRAGADSLC